MNVFNLREVAFASFVKETRKMYVFDRTKR